MAHFVEKKSHKNLKKRKTKKIGKYSEKSISFGDSEMKCGRRSWPMFYELAYLHSFLWLLIFPLKDFWNYFPPSKIGFS